MLDGSRRVEQRRQRDFVLRNAQALPFTLQMLVHARSKGAIEVAWDWFVTEGMAATHVYYLLHPAPTGDPEWDSYLFVTDQPEDAAVPVVEVVLSEGSRVLYEGVTRGDLWRSTLFDWASGVVQRAKASGYDAVHFVHQITTVIINRNAVALRREWKGIVRQKRLDLDFDWKEFAESAARTLFVMTYADEVEELPREQRQLLSPGAGGDWMDVAPPTPPSARREGETFARAFEQVVPVAVLRRIAAEIPAEEAGHLAMMQALGTGVGFGDDYFEVDVDLDWAATTIYDTVVTAVRRELRRLR